MTVNARDGEFELVTLRNGHRAVRHLGHGEVMHPSVGPWEEANQLYVQQAGLAERLRSNHTDEPLRILDLGLGAGTNAIAALTAQRAICTGGAAPLRRLELHSLEADLAPLRLALGDPEGFPFVAPFAAAAEALLDAGEWSDPEGTCRWVLHLGDCEDVLASGVRERFELIFHDPFSPESNPRLWTPSFFERLRSRAAPEGALLLTYSAATPTRVSMLLGGWFVGTGIGIGTKRETTAAASAKELLKQPLDQRWLTRWERSSARAPHGILMDTDVETAVRTHAQFQAP